MRCFIAVEFPEEIKEELENAQKNLPGDLAKLRRVEKNQFHLTLKFLGEIQPNKVEMVKEALRKVGFKPFKTALSGIGVFPNENYIRVVWIGLKPDEEIIELQKKIEKALENEFGKEKNFHSHATLARVKFVKDKKDFIEKLKKIKIEKKEFLVENFKLKKSTLTKQGPVYEDVEVFDVKQDRFQYKNGANKG